MVNMGPWDGTVWVPGIALPAHPHPPTPGTPSRYCHDAHASWDGGARGLNVVVGLRSVDQLTLSMHFSGFRGITEVYNLCIARNPDDHKHIPGTK